MDVIVVGSVVTDLVSYVSRFPVTGETLHGHKFSVGFGGKGANQCIAARRLGAVTSMVGKVGDDQFGREYWQNFERQGVFFDYVTRTSDAATGTASILVNENGENSIVVVGGANLLLNEDDIMNAKELVERSKVLVCQLEINKNITLCALKLAKSLNVLTILNPAPALANLDDEFFKYADIICPNETEAEILTDVKVKTIDDAKSAAAILHSRGCKTVIITLGNQGALVCEHNEDAIHVPTDNVKSVDSTGAGDAFVGALAFYLANYSLIPLVEKVKRSCKIASLSVQSEGTQSSYPYEKDIDANLLKY